MWTPDVQWETECDYEDVNVGQFSDWVSGIPQPDNPLGQYDRDKHWGYMDYKYMKDMFSANPHMLEAVSWKRFGFAGQSGKDSTIWLGSEHAYTVGHYDTYGCNLVAQISGRKRWILFPPEQTDHLYPTRVPFEESSVFSDVNITRPNLQKFPKLKKTTPYLVTLEAGDVLLVPRHWWHFVQCLEPAVSINTWINLDVDHEARVQEALTQTLVCAVLASDPREESKILNPNQDFLSLEENKEAIIGALREQMKAKKEPGGVRSLGKDDCRSNPPSGKLHTNVKANKRKCDVELSTERKSLKYSVSNSCQEGSNKELHEQIHVADKDTIWKQPEVTPIEPSSFQDYLTLMKTDQIVGETSDFPTTNPYKPEPVAGCDSSRPTHSPLTPFSISTRTLLNCFTHPRVISMVSDLLQDSVDINV
ncbi:HSPB1-associated protein 1 homolog isoform X2 [Liolophura sinensis]|uniref:HSPB1-associated protein 1 homolog isoform X2 n=1 Tax=Liolophura sinensis TaxID=3198878 RepID=UPI003158E890